MSFRYKSKNQRRERVNQDLHSERSGSLIANRGTGIGTRKFQIRDRELERRRRPGRAALSCFISKPKTGFGRARSLSVGFGLISGNKNPQAGIRFLKFLLADLARFGEPVSGASASAACVPELGGLDLSKPLFQVSLVEISVSGNKLRKPQLANLPQPQFQRFTR